MIIRRYNEEDRAQVKQLIFEILTEIFKSNVYGLEDLNDIAHNFELFLVVEEDGKIIATGAVKNENNEARISRMYVAKEFRGKGIGKKVLTRLLKYCKPKFSRIFLTTYPQMKATGFYEKMGFKIFKIEQRIWMEMKGDKKP